LEVKDTVTVCINTDDGVATNLRVVHFMGGVGKCASAIKIKRTCKITEVNLVCSINKISDKTPA